MSKILINGTLPLAMTWEWQLKKNYIWKDALLVKVFFFFYIVLLPLISFSYLRVMNREIQHLNNSIVNYHEKNCYKCLICYLSNSYILKIK